MNRLVLAALLAAPLAAAPLAGCSASRPPLVTIEPEFAYTRGSADVGDRADDLNAFYPVPHADTTASASAGNAASSAAGWAYPDDLIRALGQRD